jgi:hypothetical protein
VSRFLKFVSIRSDLSERRNRKGTNNTMISVPLLDTKRTNASADKSRELPLRGT